MKRHFLLMLITIIFSNCSKTEDPSPDDNDTGIIPQFTVVAVIEGKEIHNIIKTNDGGYVGYSNSGDFDIIKFDSDFNIVWNKNYGGSDDDYPRSIIQTNDDGYMVIGKTKSTDGDISVNYGGSDIWMCKLDSDGYLIWEKTYGGSNGDFVGRENSFIETSDGGYIFTGYTESNNNDISFNHGGYDLWLVKISENGTIEYEKTIGGSNDDYGGKIIKTNSNYTLLVKTTSVDGDFNAPGNWVIQIDEDANILWSTNLFGVNSGSICATLDDGFAVSITSMSEFELNILNADGSIQFTNTISFQSILSKQPRTTKILQSIDRGFIIIGALGNGNDADALLFKISPTLDLIYYKTFKGSGMDLSASLIHSNSNEFIYQFITSSTDIPQIENSSWMASAILKFNEFEN